MARYNAVGDIDQDRIDKAKFCDAGGDLFDLTGRVRARIFEAWFKLTRVLVFDGQRGHSAPQARRPKRLRSSNRESKMLGIFPFLWPAFPFSRNVFPFIF